MQNESCLNLSNLTTNNQNIYYQTECSRDYQTECSRDEIINILLFQNVIEHFGYYLDFKTISYVNFLIVVVCKKIFTQSVTTSTRS